MTTLPLPPERLVDLALHRRLQHRLDDTVLFPWRRPCTVKVLLVTDGILDFGDGDFGLSAFVDTLLNDGRGYVRFELTLAHLRADVSDAQVKAGEAGIARSIKGFRFDVASHFTSTMYDQVWLFGFESYYGGSSYGVRGNSANGYPTDRLKDTELDALTAHMNRQGGIFATGDHGSIGAGLGKAVDRVKNMRHWADFGAGEVSMQGPRRNDSNHVGHDPGSQFSDQSDDVPQPLDLKLYTAWAGLLREARYPHPVLCSPLGRIDVFPDHPHEGEARVPASLSGSCRDGSEEYPPATDGTGQVPPEIIAWGHVPAGNVAAAGGNPTKSPTVAHSFGLLSAYDGHRAAVGRVICDSTWHHFVNVNLIGILEGGGFDDFGRPGEHGSKHDGFLSSSAGLAVLQRIKHYFVNVGVWISPPERIGCMNNRLWWDLIWNDRIVEATLMEANDALDTVSVVNLWHIGVHARDVLGRRAGACQTVHLILPYFEEFYLELVPHIDPWGPLREKGEPPLPWIDHEMLVSLALGGALVALRAEYPYPAARPPEFDDRTRQVVARGMAMGVDRGLASLSAQLKDWNRLAASGRRGVDAKLAEPVKARRSSRKKKA
jgi:hypothetical protein